MVWVCLKPIPFKNDSQYLASWYHSFVNRRGTQCGNDHGSGLFAPFWCTGNRDVVAKQFASQAVLLVCCNISEYAIKLPGNTSLVRATNILKYADNDTVVLWAHKVDNMKKYKASDIADTLLRTPQYAVRCAQS
jgi:hypothetical protein